MVGVTVDGKFVGVADSTVDIGGTVVGVGDGVGDGRDAQAATKTPARTSTIICIQGLGSITIEGSIVAILCISHLISCD